MYHKEEEYSLDNKKQNIEDDQRDLVGKHADNKSIRNMLFGRTSQNGLLVSELSLSLRGVRFSE